MEILQPPLFLPDELLEFIADGVDLREDLLALALTCSAFCRVIIPERLYRSVVVSITNTDYLTRLSQKPKLIEHVYQVTVVNTTIVTPSSLRYGEPIPLIDWTKTTNTPEVFLEQLMNALALCSNLQCLRLNSGLQDSYRMTEESINRILSPLVNNLKDVCLDITRFHTSPTFSLWKARNLRTLELIISGIDRFDWNDLCTVLESSPQLETLSLPSISLAENAQINPLDLPRINPLPHLPRLKHLSAPVSFSDATTELAFYTFLHANPSIEDLRWMSPSLPSADNMPLLPNLRRLRPGTASAVFLQRFLEGKASGSVRLESLECYRKGMHLPPLLNALDPQSLQALHMQDGSLPDIKALAGLFTHIKDLVLPHMPTYAMREPQGLLQRMRETVITATPSNASKRTYALLDDIVPLFPALQRICHVDVNTGTPEADKLLTKLLWWPQYSASFVPSASAFQSISTGLLHIRRSYPQLLSVNGWRLEEGMEEKVVLIRSVTGMQYLGMVAPKSKFWLGKEGFGIGLTEAGFEAAV
ncbi:unnamed protein product [Peniophora sp. CBMAI 1063]|nr:unnamed protein product [Peniophora sp. CBMAI 1063]